MGSGLAWLKQVAAVGFCSVVGAYPDEPGFDYWNKMEQNLERQGLEVIENKVARDGIEPPTPAFSGLRSTD